MLAAIEIRKDSASGVSDMNENNNTDYKQTARSDVVSHLKKHTEGDNAEQVLTDISQINS